MGNCIGSGATAAVPVQDPVEAFVEGGERALNRAFTGGAQSAGSMGSSNNNSGNTLAHDASINSMPINNGGSMTEMFARQMSEEEETDLLAELKAERERVLKEQQFLLTIREALLAMQGGLLDSDEEEETQAPVKMATRKRRNRFSIRPRKLEKHDSFQLNDGRGWAPVTDVKQSKRASVRNQLRRSIKRVDESRIAVRRQKPTWSTTLEGQGSRAWNNPFASRLQLMLKFYDWKDIPMEFFIDQYVADIGHSALTARPRLAARLAERRKLNARRKDNRNSIRQSLRRSSIQKTLDDVRTGLAEHEKKVGKKNQRRFAKEEEHEEEIEDEGYETDNLVRSVREDGYSSDSSDETSTGGLI